MSSLENLDEFEDTHKPFMFLGSDLSKIVCFRTSMLSGVCTGLAASIGYAFVTGKFRRVLNVFAYTAFPTVLLVWFPCRFHYSYQKMQIAQIKAMSMEAALRSGTNLDFSESDTDYSSEDKLTGNFKV